MSEAYERVKQTILTAAAEYINRHNKPPVLIIDNVNRLAQKSPDMLEMLQDFAKDCADRSHLLVMFVGSEGHAPCLLQSKYAVCFLNLELNLNLS
jgi:hypothetical protein